MLYFCYRSLISPNCDSVFLSLASVIVTVSGTEAVSLNNQEICY
jgi:hypothetical protein